MHHCHSKSPNITQDGEELGWLSSPIYELLGFQSTRYPLIDIRDRFGSMSVV